MFAFGLTSSAPRATVWTPDEASGTKASPAGMYFPPVRFQRRPAKIVRSLPLASVPPTSVARADARMAKFFSGVFNYVFNELLVESLANSRAFQRFAVRTDKAMREASHESNRIGQEHMLTFVEVEASGSWIQCGEQFIFRERFGSGQFVEQRGFSCVSIADYGYCWYGFSQAFSPLHLAMLDNLLELPFDDGDAIVDHTPVGLQLGFTLATGPCHAASLSAKVRPRASESGQGVFHTGQSHL